MRMNNLHIIICFIVNGVYCQLYIDKSKWVDPGDMLRYRGPKHQENIGAGCKEDIEELNAKLQECRVSLAVAETGRQETMHCAAGNEDVEGCNAQTKTFSRNDAERKRNEMLFLRRYVKHLLNYMSYEGKDMENLIKIKLSIEDYTTLTEFADERTSDLHDIDAVLTGMIRDIYPVDKVPGIGWMIDDYQVYYILAPAILLVLFLLPIFYRVCCWCVNHYFLSLGLVVFKASAVWHFLRLYKEALAKKAATMEQNSRMPIECFPDAMSWMQSIKAAFSKEEKCYTYHRAVMVDAIYDVTPFTAITDMIASQFTAISKALGSGFGLFYNAFLNELPFYLGIPLLLVLMVMMGFFLLVLCGYQFRFWPFVSIAPAQNNAPRLQGNVYQPPQAVIHHIADPQHTRELLALLTNQRVQQLPPTQEVAGGVEHTSEVQPLDTPALSVPSVRNQASNRSALTEHISENNVRENSVQQQPSSSVFRTAYDTVTSLISRPRYDDSPQRDSAQPTSEASSSHVEFEEGEIVQSDFSDFNKKNEDTKPRKPCKACGDEDEETKAPKENELNRLLEKCAWPPADEDGVDEVRNRRSGEKFHNACGDRL